MKFLLSGIRQDLPLKDFEYVSENDMEVKICYQGGGEIEYSNNIEYSNDNELYPYIDIKGEKYFITDFLRFDKKCDFISINFDGYMSTSYFSCDLIRIDDNNDSAYLYTVYN